MSYHLHVKKQLTKIFYFKMGPSKGKNCLCIILGKTGKTKEQKNLMLPQKILVIIKKIFPLFCSDTGTIDFCLTKTLNISIMQIHIEEGYNDISKLAANRAVELLQNAKSPLVCVASGDSPKGMYKELAHLKSSLLCIKDWNYISLDEWVGMDETTEGSCSFHLSNDLFKPLQLSAEKICCFNGKAENLQKECDRIERFIASHGGIEIAIVGIGTNGHIAMNEPGTSPLLKTHISVIANETQEAGQKYFNHPQVLTHGITVGLATLMEAKHIFLIASGGKKANIIKQLLTAEKSAHLPCTMLRDHPGFHVFLDQEAAALIPHQLTV
jgi:galactosamine-6-phosphate isomerase